MEQASVQQNRFKDASWFPQEDEKMIIGGAGGIGSWLAFFLTKAGFKPILYDFDRVEEHNLGGQLFRQDDVGRFKTEAVKRIIDDFIGDDIEIINHKIDNDTPYHHFMFSAFDNMRARKAAFEVWQKSIEGCAVTPIFIDGRLEMEQLQIFCVTPDRIEQYKEHLFNDAEVPDAPCTMRQTSHSAAMIASHMTGFFTNHIANIYTRAMIRDVPFFFEHFIPAGLTNSH